jgi:DHA3 family macrolide efflux protein-like MFS transporter
MKTWDEIALIKKESLPLWKNRDFIILCLALFISGIGDGIFKIALLWLSYKLTGSTAAMGIVFACLTLPGIFSGFLAGALADRFSKKKVFITANFVLTAAAFFFVLAYHYQSILAVYLLSFLMGAFFTFDSGPFRAYLPEIFPEDRLSKVNAAVSSVQSLTMVVGPALGGIIIVAGKVGLAFLIDAATFFAAALLMCFLPLTLPRMAEGSIKVRAIFRDIKAGVGYLVESPSHRFIILFFVCLFGIYCFAGGLITPLCEKDLSVSNHIEGSMALGIILAIFGLGGFIGGFFIPHVIRKFGCVRTLVFGAFLCAVELFAFGYIADIFFLAAIILFTASSGPMLMVPLFTFIQEKTKPRFIGRAMGALDTAVLSVISLSFVFGGVLAGAIGVINVFKITGAAILVLTAATTLLPIYKKLRLMGKES